MWWNCNGERMPIRFGDWSRAGSAGVAALGLDIVRGHVGTGIGFRLAYIS